MGFVADAVEDVADAVVDVIDWTVDEVIDPVVDFVGDTIEAALDDPITTAATIWAAVTPGMQWTIPLIQGASVAAQGGDLEDVAKAVAVSFIAQEAGTRVGNAVAANTTNAATAANYGTTYASRQTALLAAQEAGMQTAAQVAGNLAGSVAGSTAVAIVTGQDPVQAMLRGGINAAVPAVLGQIEGFGSLPNSAQKVIETAVKTQLAGGNVEAAIIRSAIVSTQIATDVIRQLDPNKTLTKGQSAILADVVTAAASAAFTNGNVSQAIQREVFNAGSKALGDLVTGKFKELTSQTEQSSNKMTQIAGQIQDNEEKQAEIARNYNIVRDQLNTRIAEQDRLKAVMDADIADANAKVQQFNNGQIDRATADAAITKANTSVGSYNSYVNALNIDYEQVFKLDLDKYKAELDALQIPHDKLITDFTAEQNNLKDIVSKLGPEIQTLENSVKKSFVGVMDTNFNPTEYAKINKLEPNVDPYSHWLSTGQYQSLPTNYKDAETAVYKQEARLLSEALQARNLTLSNLTNDDRERFDKEIEQKFGNDFTALKNATIADFDIDNVLKTSSSLTVNQDFAKGAYNAENRPGLTSYKPPDGYTLATNDQILKNEAVLMPASDGKFAWLSNDPNSNYGMRWNPEVGDNVMWINIEGVGIPRLPDVTVEATRIGGTLEEMRDADPLAWFYVVDEFNDAQKKAGLGETVYNFVKDAYTSFKDSLSPETKEALGKFAAAAKPETSTLAILEGGIVGLKSIVDVFGAGTPLSKSFDDAKGYIQSLYSAKAIGDQKLAAQILQDAENKGVLDKVIAVAEAVAAYPQVIAQGAGTLAPNLLVGTATSILGAPLVLARYAQIGTGAVSGAGIIKGTIYDETKKALINAGIDPGIAEIQAQKAQAYNGQNLPSIVAGAVFGAAASLGPPEQLLVKEIASNVAEGVSAKIAAKQFVTGGLKEALPEFAQGAQEQQATNLALQNAGFDVPTWQGVMTSGLYEAAAAAPLGGAANVASNMQQYDLAYTTRQELEQAARDQGYTLKPEDYAKFTGAIDEQPTLEAFQSYADPLVTLESEAREFLAAQGYVNPREEDVQAIAGQLAEDQARQKAVEVAEPNIFDIEEVKAAAQAEGYAITDEQARAVARQANEAEATAAFRAEINPLATTETEAKQFFQTYGYVPEAAELAQFVVSKPESEVKNLIGQYVDPRQVTAAEVEAAIRQSGYNPDSAEIQQFVRQGAGISQEDVIKEIGAYVDPRYVSENEVRDAYAALGLNRPTSADIQALVGQYAQTDLGGRAQANLEAARYNSLVEQLDQLSQGASPEVMRTIDLVKQDLNKQIASVGGDVSQLAQTLETQFGSLTEAQKQLANQLIQQGSTLTDAVESARTSLTGQIAGLSEDVQAKYNALTAAQKAEVDNRIAMGESLQNAIQTTAAGLGTQIGQLEQTVQNQYTQLNAAQKAEVDARIAMGESLTSAIQNVASQVSQEIGGVRADVQAKYAALTAEQKALADQLARQGVDLNAAIEQARAGITAEVQTKYNALTDQQKALADQLAKQGVDLNAAIEQARAATQQQISGVQQDVQAKFDALTDIQKQFATQLTQQGVDTNTAIEAAKSSLGTQITGVGAQVTELARQQEAARLAAEEAARQQVIRDRVAADRSARAQQQAQAQALAAEQLKAIMGAQQPIPADEAAKFKQPFITSQAKQEQFKGPLQEFMQEVQRGDYTQDQFAAPQSQTSPQMQQNIEQGGAMPNYFTYGQQTDIDQLFSPSGGFATAFPGFEPFMAKRGGLATPLMAGGGIVGYAGGGLPMVPHSGKMRVDFRSGAAVSGPGDGQSDDIPAMLADGEFVFPADVVAALGNGSTKAGSEKLYDMMHSIRSHHRSAKPQDLPPPAKASPLDYLSSKKSAKAARR